jgi:2-hydroxymuconate-semialdehyde hydrolase
VTDSRASANPEIGSSIDVNGIRTNYHDVGSGSPVLLIHGSGPGVSAWVNWRSIIPTLSQRHRVIAPDVVGFGYTDYPPHAEYNRNLWQSHIIGFLDALSLERVSIVGNSFGGDVAMWLAIDVPDRVDKMVLMGSSVVTFDLTPELDEVWGLEVTVEAMRKALTLFAYNQGLVTDELVDTRLRAYARNGVHQAYLSMFPAPRQRWIDSLASDPDKVAKVSHPTLVIHGRDDAIVPVSVAYDIFDLLDNCQLHIFGKCGHWTQVEYARTFATIVADFLHETNDAVSEAEAYMDTSRGTAEIGSHKGSH